MLPGWTAAAVAFAELVAEELLARHSNWVPIWGHRITYCEKSSVVLVQRLVVGNALRDVLVVALCTVSLRWRHMADYLASIQRHPVYVRQRPMIKYGYERGTGLHTN